MTFSNLSNSESVFNTAIQLREEINLCVIASGQLRIDDSTGEKTYKSPYPKWKHYNKYDNPDATLPTIEDMVKWNQFFEPTLWGIVTGAISGIIGIDIDDPALKDIFDKAGLKPHNKTRRGWHYYFKHPGHFIKTTASVIMPHLDVRGDGGFINCLGKNQTAEYELLIWPKPDTWYSLQELPIEVKEAWQKLAYENQQQNPKQPIGNSIDQGHRHSQIIHLIGLLRHAGVSDDLILDTLLTWDSLGKINPPLGVNAIQRMVNQYQHQSLANNIKVRGGAIL